MTLHNYLAIDPGTIKSGWCWMVREGKEFAYQSSGMIYADDKKADWLDRSDSIIAQYLHLVDARLALARVARIIVELPTTRFRSERGQAASNSEAVVKLYGMTIALRYALLDLGIVGDVVLTPVSQWKGQVPKHVNHRRLKRRWGFVPDEEDEADAFGIADWYLRKERGFVIRKP